MKHLFLLAVPLVSLLFGVVSQLPAETSTSRLSMAGPESTTDPSVIVPLESELAHPNGAYHGQQGVLDPTCRCGEYFGGFGPLWANYCQQESACGRGQGCGVACGSMSCGTTCPACRPARPRIMRYRWLTDGGVRGKSKKGDTPCDCGSAMPADLDQQPPDIGKPPEPQPAPPSEAVEASRLTPATETDLDLPTDRSARRPWRRHE